MDDAQFGREIEALRKRLRMTALKWCYGHNDRADDLVQITMLKAWQGRAGFSDGSLISWLTVIMRNYFYSSHRKGALIIVDDRDGVLTEGYSDELMAAETCVELADVMRTINTLPPHLRSAIMMIAEGKEYEEIAAALNTSVGTIKSRVNRTRHRLTMHRPMPHAS